MVSVQLGELYWNTLYTLYNTHAQSLECNANATRRVIDNEIYQNKSYIIYLIYFFFFFYDIECGKSVN